MHEQEIHTCKMLDRVNVKAHLIKSQQLTPKEQKAALSAFVLSLGTIRRPEPRDQDSRPRQGL